MICTGTSFISEPMRQWIELYNQWYQINLDLYKIWYGPYFNIESDYDKDQDQEHSDPDDQARRS